MALNTSFDSPLVFRHYVERNAVYALSLLEASPAQVLPRKTIQTVLQAVQFALSLPDIWPTSSRILLELAPRMELLDLRLIWRPYLEDGVYQSVIQGDERSEMLLQYYLGNQLRESADYEGAVEHYERGLILAKKLQCMPEKTRILNRYAFTLRRQRKFEQAETYARQALEIASKPPQNPEEQGYSYLVLGAIRFDRRQWLECLVYSNKTLDLWEKYGETRELPWAHINLGALSLRLNNLEEAKKHLQIAISLLHGQGDIIYLAIAKMNLGIALTYQGQLQEALTQLLGAEKVFRSVQDKLRTAMVAHNLAFAYEKLQRWKDAIAAYQASIAFRLELNDVLQALNTMDSLTTLFLSLGQIENAQNLLRQATDLLATLEGEEKEEYEHWRNVFAEIREDLRSRQN